MPANHAHHTTCAQTASMMRLLKTGAELPHIKSMDIGLCTLTWTSHMEHLLPACCPPHPHPCPLLFIPSALVTPVLLIHPIPCAPTLFRPYAPTLFCADFP